MKKIDNKGVTIVEILLSVSIIGIVMVFFFSVLTSIKEEDTKSASNSLYLANQSTLIEAVNEDIINYGLTEVANCEYTNFMNVSSLFDTNSKIFCTKFTYDNNKISDNIGYLLIYNEAEDTTPNSKKNWTITYQRGEFRGNKTETPANWLSMKKITRRYDEKFVTNDLKILAKRNNGENSNIMSIIIPIRDGADNHYDIVVSAYNPDKSISCIGGSSSETASNLTCEG